MRADELCALSEEVGEHLAGVLVGEDFTVIGVEFEAGLAQARAVGIEGAKVFVAHHRGFRDEAEGAFQILKAQRAVEFEFHFRAVEQVEDREVMLLEAQVLQAAEERFQLAEKIGEDKHERAAADFLREIVQAAQERGGAARRLL